VFPVARHKDFFDGHSWASGLFPMANGKSQESVSEAANAYYGVHLLGVALGDDALSKW
jgi:endo-1,3(4)-beta-glucanase